MKVYLKKLSFFLLSMVLVFGACDVEESLTLTQPDAAFKLNTPGITNVFLNFSLPDNPAFTISWDDQINGSGTYEVEMARDDSFATAVALGSTDKSNFTMTVAQFNAAINDTGVTQFRDIAIYMRVKNGSSISNTILMLVTTYPVNAPTVGGVADGDAFTLLIADNNNVAMTIMANDPILSSGLVNVDYTLEAATPGTDFATPIEITTVSNQADIPVKTSEINAAAIQSGIAADATGDVQLRINSLITDPNTGVTLRRVSDPITITVTTYKAVLDLSTTWGVVGSAANNWGATPDLPFWKTDVDGVLAAYVNLIDGEIKFRENNDWANNYGSNSSTGGALVAGGGNIAVTAGSYKIVMDLNQLTYTIEPFSLGIVGSGYNNWGATPDFMLEYDQYSDVFRGMVTLLDGEIKFRMNNDWGTNWGDNGADGTMELNGANIQSTAGIYLVKVDLNTLEYELTKIDHVWGLVGSAYNNWGASPDAQFRRDWSQPLDDVWILENVDLLDGEWKIRANNDWGVNYGDNGADGTLERDGANLPSTAGNYTITLNFSNNPPTISVVQN
ncbi:MAG: hypothetical protein CMB99_07670 [Flavobacteriaceae bacterium]|nr:hypothetical protein [Flavobacteriaceae bacterium]|tara:strand:+ start:64550 stop:66229 length:1680 start_codon:yes stop_codon:yes gene_type:complete